MNYKTEMVLPAEAKPDADVLFDVAAKVPPEKQAGFLEFLRGVNYGLEMANRQSATGNQQASA